MWAEQNRTKVTFLRGFSRSNLASMRIWDRFTSPKRYSNVLSAECRFAPRKDVKLGNYFLQRCNGERLCDPEMNSGRRDLKTISPVQLFNSSAFKPAFTLAEVLITLGIIGVVAAMTIPTLMQNIQERH